MIIIVIIILIGIYIYSRWKDGQYFEQNKQNYSPVNRYKASLYENHCWNCQTHIDSRTDKLCPKCGKWYICSKCGACKCDYPIYPKYADTNTSNNLTTSNAPTNLLDDVFKDKDLACSREANKEFYIELRILEAVLGGVSEGLAQFSPTIKQEKLKYVLCIDRCKQYAKPEYSKELLELLKKETAQFFDNISIADDGTVNYDKTVLADIVFGVQFFLKVGIDITFIERLESEESIRAAIKQLL